MNQPITSLSIDPFIFADLIADESSANVMIFRTWMGKNGGAQKELYRFATVDEARTKLDDWATDLFTLSLQTIVGWWDEIANERREYRADFGLNGKVTFREHIFAGKNDPRHTGYPVYQSITPDLAEVIA